MLRGFALAILLINLVLFFWGSGRAGPGRVADGEASSRAEASLPALQLLDDTSALRPWPDLSPCLSLGPLPAEDAAAVVTILAAWGLSWRRRAGADGDFLEIEPGAAADWPEGQLSALGDAMNMGLFPCRTP